MESLSSDFLQIPFLLPSYSVPPQALPHFLFLLYIFKRSQFTTSKIFTNTHTKTKLNFFYSEIIPVDKKLSIKIQEWSEDK